MCIQCILGCVLDYGYTLSTKLSAQSSFFAVVHILGGSATASIEFLVALVTLVIRIVHVHMNKRLGEVMASEFTRIHLIRKL